MSETVTKTDGNNMLPHRQLVAEEVQFIKQQTADFAERFNLTSAQAEKQLTRGALYSIDADWQKTYQTNTPDEFAGYKIAATYLQAQSKAQSLIFTNQEKDIQAAFTVTPAQNDEKYGLRAALLNPQIRDLYERNARLTNDEKSLLPELLVRPMVDAYILHEAAIEKLAGIKKVTEPGDMNLANAPHPIDGLKKLTNSLIEDPIGTLGKMKDGMLDGVQNYVLTKYISEMQGDIVKASQADAKAVVDVGTGVVSGYAGVKAASFALDAVKASEVGVLAIDKANDAAQLMKDKLEQAKTALLLHGGANGLVAPRVGPVGLYLDMGNPEDNVPKAGIMMAHSIDKNEGDDFQNPKYGNNLKAEKAEIISATEEELRNVRQGRGRNHSVPGYEGIIDQMYAHNIGDNAYNGIKAVKFLNESEIKFFRHEDTKIEQISLNQALDVFKGNNQAQHELLESVKNLGGNKQIEQLKQDLSVKVQTGSKLAADLIVAIGNTDHQANWALNLLNQGADGFKEAADAASRAKYSAIEKKWSADGHTLRPEVAEQAKLYQDYRQALVDFKIAQVKQQAIETGADATNQNPLIKSLNTEGYSSEYFDMTKVKADLLAYQDKRKVMESTKPLGEELAEKGNITDQRTGRNDRRIAKQENEFSDDEEQPHNVRKVLKLETDPNDKSKYTYTVSDNTEPEVNKDNQRKSLGRRSTDRVANVEEFAENALNLTEKTSVPTVERKLIIDRRVSHVEDIEGDDTQQNVRRRVLKSGSRKHLVTDDNEPEIIKNQLTHPNRRASDIEIDQQTKDEGSLDKNNPLSFNHPIKFLENPKAQEIVLARISEQKEGQNQRARDSEIV